ncbi:MAG: VOC family protein [Candidatus Dormibacteraeota bacterium]|nr:VOC family protein [Candidatus Dormibacteraeota bacterium]
MTVRAIEHVQLAMPPGGEPRAVAFYAGLLDLPQRQKPAELARRGGCWFESDDVKLHLGVETEFRPARKAHPALLVDDLTSLRERLRAAGYECAEPDRFEGHDRTYVDDPFGNRIELIGA